MRTLSGDHQPPGTIADRTDYTVGYGYTAYGPDPLITPTIRAQRVLSLSLSGHYPLAQGSKHAWRKIGSIWRFATFSVIGVASQREIENAVREAVKAGRLRGSETLKARMTLEIGAISLRHEIDGD